MWGAYDSQRHGGRKWRGGRQGLRERGHRSAVRSSIWEDENVLKVDGGADRTECHQTVQLKMVKAVYFMLCVILLQLRKTKNKTRNRKYYLTSVKNSSDSLVSLGQIILLVSQFSFPRVSTRAFLAQGRRPVSVTGPKMLWARRLGLSCSRLCL